MPGHEIIGKEEKRNLTEIFEKSNGVLFGHAFEKKRNNIFRVREFEKKVCEKLKIKYCVATTSGTMAQYVAMKALGVKKNDEVITQAFTFVATVEAIIALGAKPIILDIDDSFNMCPIELKKKISKKTKLIIPVPMLGNPCDMSKINRLAKKYDIPILEDACESLGAKYKGSFVGTKSDIGIYSLDFAKTITTGEGGLIVTNNKKLYTFCKEFVDHGHQNVKKLKRGLDTCSIPGLNLRMNEMQGAVGLAQLKKLDKIISENKKNKLFLKKNIKLNDKKFGFRKIHDRQELCDTLIITLKNRTTALKMQNYLEKFEIFTKNLPDAIKWHFAGNWGHIFKRVPIYKKNYKSIWKKTRILLERSISLPININEKPKRLLFIAKKINSFLESN